MKIPNRTYTGAALFAALLLAGCQSGGGGDWKEVAAQDAGDAHVLVLSQTGGLAQGDNRFRIAFRSAGGQPLEVSGVSISSSMSMPGMAPMVAPIEIEPAGEPGQYALNGTFAMSGAWQFEVRWNSAAGPGTASFNVNVR